jgi:hypothetical protein
MAQREPAVSGSSAQFPSASSIRRAAWVWSAPGGWKRRTSRSLPVPIEEGMPVALAVVRPATTGRITPEMRIVEVVLEAGTRLELRHDVASHLDVDGGSVLRRGGAGGRVRPPGRGWTDERGADGASRGGKPQPHGRAEQAS